MSNKLETLNLGSVSPVTEKGVNLITVLAVTTKQTLFTGADEAVITVDGVYDVTIGQQLIISQTDEPGIYHVVGVKEAVAVKTASTTARTRQGACHDKAMPTL